MASQITSCELTPYPGVFYTSEQSSSSKNQAPTRGWHTNKFEGVQCAALNSLNGKLVAIVEEVFGELWEARVGGGRETKV